jgi:ferredoxin
MAKKKIKIDCELCMGCGACAASYPDDIVMNDEGHAVATTGEADEEALSICPFGAISEEE